MAKIKAFASTTHDKARMAYARKSESRPRQNIFVGTTNDGHYLKDETGNRRFLPVKTNVINLERLERDRDQLWAEAVMLEAQEKRVIALPPELWEYAAKEQEKRMETHPWEDILRGVAGKDDIAHGYYRISSQRILSDVLDLKVSQQQRYHSSQLAKLMRKLGWDGPKVLTMKDGRKKRGYEKPVEESNAQEGEESPSSTSSSNASNGEERRF